MVNIDFHNNTVGFADQTVAMFLQHVQYGTQIGTARNRSDDISRIVKYCQPCSQSIRGPDNIVCIDFVIPEFFDDVGADPRVIHHADKCRPEFNIGDIFGYIPADTAMRMDHAPDVSAARDILIQRISLDIHKNSPEDHNAHNISFLVELAVLIDCRTGQFIAAVVFRMV